ncbi:MAG TPA: molybdenum cofactor biosynthesis protein MoaE [Candidatus Obscuribacterales bacterium]
MFILAKDTIDIESLRLRLDDERAGALATFEGRVRNHNDGRSVTLLEYEAYEALANAEAARILEEARQRFAIYGCLCAHRVGALRIGDVAVFVAVISAHRGEAFDACRFIIDEIKHRVPIWKKEHYTDGETAWVNCAHSQEHVHSTDGLQPVLAGEPPALERTSELQPVLAGEPPALQRSGGRKPASRE